MDNRNGPEDGGRGCIFFRNFENISHCYMTPKPGRENSKMYK
jgi:hypothetical protein